MAQSKDAEDHAPPVTNDATPKPAREQAHKGEVIDICDDFGSSLFGDENDPASPDIQAVQTPLSPTTTPPPPPPARKRAQEGDTIVKEGDFLKESFKAVESMDNSYLYFQGPPGVGKTHTAAHIIIVAGNSEKVLSNIS